MKRELKKLRRELKKWEKPCCKCKKPVAPFVNCWEHVTPMGETAKIMISADDLEKFHIYLTFCEDCQKALMEWIGEKRYIERYTNFVEEQIKRRRENEA